MCMLQPRRRFERGTWTRLFLLLANPSPSSLCTMPEFVSHGECATDVLLFFCDLDESRS